MIMGDPPSKRQQQIQDLLKGAFGGSIPKVTPRKPAQTAKEAGAGAPEKPMDLPSASQVQDNR